MPNESHLSEDEKLSVILRVEHGCLGPSGIDYVSDFCAYAQKQLEGSEPASIIYSVMPRTVNSVPEIEYRIMEKTLPQDKAARLLAVFDKDIGEFEDALHESLSDMIEDFFKRS